MSAPEVKIQEIDLSQRVPAFPGVYGGIVLKARKGPVDAPVLVSTDSKLLLEYTPNGTVGVSDDLGFFSALAFLEKSDKLWVIRAAQEDVLFGGATLVSSGSATAFAVGVQDPSYKSFPGEAVAHIYGVNPGEWNNGVGIRLVAPRDTDTVLGASVDLEGSALTVDKNLVGGATTWIAGEAVRVSGVSGAALPSPLKAGETYYVIPLTDLNGGGSGSSYDGLPVIQLAATMLDALNSVEIDLNVAANESFTVASGSINSGALSTLSATTTWKTGTPVKLTATTLPAGLTDTAVYYLINVTPGTLKLAATWAESMAGEGVTIGTGGSALTVAKYFGIKIAPLREVKTQYASTLEVYAGGNFTTPVERFDVSLHRDAKDGYGKSSFLEEVLKSSSYVRGIVGPKDSGTGALPWITDLADIPDWKLGETYVAGAEVKSGGRTWVAGENHTATDASGEDNSPGSGSAVSAWSRTYVPSAIPGVGTGGPLMFAGGSEGSESAVSTSDLVRAVAKLSNPDQTPLTVVMDGGNVVPAFQLELIKLAEARMDCVAILSSRQEDEVSSDYLNDIVRYKRETLNSVSSFAAMYTPHVKVLDRFNGRDLYVAPDGYAAAAISNTAYNYEMWYPVGGYRRGKVNVTDLARRFSKGELDYLYDKNLNPIRFVPGRGIVIWGQKTLQTVPSALDRLNVRMLLIVIEPAVAESLQAFLFELNDAATRATAGSMVRAYMEGIKARRGVYDFKVTCDDSNNTPADVDNYVMNLWLFIKPTKPVEYIPFKVVITSSGMDFSLAAQSL